MPRPAAWMAPYINARPIRKIKDPALSLFLVPRMSADIFSLIWCCQITIFAKNGVLRLVSGDLCRVCRSEVNGFCARAVPAKQHRITEIMMNMKIRFMILSEIPKKASRDEPYRNISSLPGPLSNLF